MMCREGVRRHGVLPYRELLAAICTQKPIQADVILFMERKNAGRKPAGEAVNFSESEAHANPGDATIFCLVRQNAAGVNE
jgi:hypothetical protein